MEEAGIKMEQLRDALGWRTVETYIEARQLSYAGRVLRYPENRIEAKVLRSTLTHDEEVPDEFFKSFGNKKTTAKMLTTRIAQVMEYWGPSKQITIQEAIDMAKHDGGASWRKICKEIRKEDVESGRATSKLVRSTPTPQDKLRRSFKMQKRRATGSMRIVKIARSSLLPGCSRPTSGDARDTR